MNPSRSIGEFRVRTEFNPDNNTLVDQIKQKSAELINLCNSIVGNDPRLAALAMTGYEDAAMWAVKLATATPPAAMPSGNAESNTTQAKPDTATAGQ